MHGPGVATGLIQLRGERKGQRWHLNKETEYHTPTYPGKGSRIVVGLSYVKARMEDTYGNKDRTNNTHAL